MSGATRRINRGRYHSYLLDGQAVDGVTTIISKGIPKPALVAWAAGQVAEFVSSRLPVLAELDHEELIDLCKGAPFRERDKAANRGTAVHHIADQLARDEEVDVPQELVGHVDAYLAFREAWKPADELVERAVFNRKHRYAGTFDLWAKLPELGKTLVDIKTNRSGPFGEVGLQLAAYGRADFMLGENGEEVPMPDIDSYAVLWVRADGYDLYPYEVTEREWKAFLYAQQVAWWLEQRAQRVRGEALWRPRVVKEVST